jgi:two-component system, OmpR family, sensor histidine kinase KdpD
MTRARSTAAAIVLLAAATVVAFALEAWGGIDNASSVYLLAVASVALLSGTAAAIATAIGAFLVYNFLFIDPRFSLAVAEPQSVLTLLLLLVIGTIVGRLTSVGRDRARESARREREARALFAISRAFATDPAEEALPAVVDRIAAETEMDRVWIGLGGTRVSERVVADTDAGAPPASSQVAILRRDRGERDARWVHVHEPMPARPSAPGAGDLFRVEIGADEERLGSLNALRRRGRGDPSIETSRLLAVAADQVAQTLRRDRLARRALDVEVAERSDAAKSALLDLVSHELRTPLAAIRASAGSLADLSLALGVDERQLLAQAIDAEAMRLNRLVGNLLDMSRLQAGRVVADIEVIPLEDAVEGVIDRMEAVLGGRRVKVSMADGLPPVLADATLLEQVLGNVIDNAARYSDASAPIRVSAASVDHGMVEICVEDGGPGVPEEEREAIFERFYRRQKSRQSAGTGLGLPLVRGLVSAMGGSVAARESGLGGLAIAVQLRSAPPPR